MGPSGQLWSTKRAKRCMCIDATHRYSPEHADDHRREDPIHGVQRSSRNPEPYGGGSQTRGCGEVGFEARNVSYKVHNLLECTNGARSQAHPSHAQTPQLVGNVDVLSVRGRALGLLHGDLNLERPPSKPPGDGRDVPHGRLPPGQGGDHDEPARTALALVTRPLFTFTCSRLLSPGSGFAAPCRGAQ